MASPTKTPRLAAALLACAAGYGLIGLSPSPAVAADFSGKRVQILVPFSEGGGTDSWTRMMAPYLEKKLAGNPKVLVVNRPGAAGITGANYYQEKAPKDGTWIFALSVSTALNYALRDPKFKTKFEDYHPVLNSPRGSVLFTRKELGIQDVKDIKGKINKLQSYPPEKLPMGGRTPTSVDLLYMVALTLLGIEVKSVWGLGGTGPMALGFERGEFMIMGENALAFQSLRKHMIADGIANPLFTWGTYDANGKYGRDPSMPHLPSYLEVYEAVHGKKPSGPGIEAWKALHGLDVPMNKSLLLHPDTPKEYVEVWVNGVREMLKDQEFLQKAAPEFGPYPQIVGDAARPIMQTSFAIPPDARAWLAKYVKSRYDVNLAQ
jgi:tripartite-type tricarboxylate transporter receptor subunit TctC